MFTGIVETLGEVTAARVEGDGVRLQVRSPMIACSATMGASVAVNGVCLTVVRFDETSFDLQAGPETLRLTNLGELRPGGHVNLERPLRMGDRLGGHLVQGHVDGMAVIVSRQVQGEWETVWFRCESRLTRMMIPKGSIAVDGVSLTLVEVTADGFSVALIPHTLEVTTLGKKVSGDSVNIEVDMFGKYVLKHLEAMDLRAPPQKEPSR